jgi:hypothetical protein
MGGALVFLDRNELVAKCTIGGLGDGESFVEHEGLDRGAGLSVAVARLVAVGILKAFGRDKQYLAEPASSRKRLVTSA